MTRGSFESAGLFARWANQRYLAFATMVKASFFLPSVRAVGAKNDLTYGQKQLEATLFIGDSIDKGDLAAINRSTSHQCSL
jgi:hypothetical protein